MEENVTMVFHGFLCLSGKEKLSLVDEINNYFDSNEREEVRRNAEARLAAIEWRLPEKSCKCCGR